MIVAGARLMMAKPPSRRSDIVIGARAGSTSVRRRSPARRIATRSPSAGAAPRQQHRGRPTPRLRSTGPATSGGVLEGVPSRHTGPRGGLRRVDVRRPLRRRLRRLVRRRHRCRGVHGRGSPRWRAAVPSSSWGWVRAGWRSRWPPAGWRSTASTRPPQMLARLRDKPGAEAIHLTTGDMADLALVDPPEFTVVFVAFNTLFNLATAAQQQRCLERVATLLAPDGLFVVEAFVPADDDHGSALVGHAAPHLRRRGGAGGRASHDERDQTITGQHVHLTEAGHPAAPLAPPLRRSARARRHGGGGRARARVAARGLGGDARSVPTRASTCPAIAAVTSEPCSPPAPYEPAPAQPAHGALGHRRGRAGLATWGAHLPAAAGGGRPVAEVPVLPRQRGGHAAGARDLRPGRHLAGAGGAEPVPCLRGQRAAAGAEPRSGVHAGVGQRRARGAGVQPRAHRQLGRPRRQARRPGHGRHPRSHGGPRPSHHGAVHAGDRERRPGGRARRSSTRTGSSSASRSCPARSPRRRPASDASASRACCARWPRPSARSEHRVVIDDERVLVVCPYWSGAPYEMLVMPRTHEVHLENTSPPDVVAVGRAIRDALAAAALQGRRRLLQPRVPHRAAPPRRAVPLARPHRAAPHQPGRVRTGHRRDDQHRRPGARRPTPHGVAGGRGAVPHRLVRCLLPDRLHRQLAAAADLPRVAVGDDGASASGSTATPTRASCGCSPSRSCGAGRSARRPSARSPPDGRPHARCRRTSCAPRWSSTSRCSGWFKYYGFFVDSVRDALDSIGLGVEPCRCSRSRCPSASRSSRSTPSAT